MCVNVAPKRIHETKYSVGDIVLVKSFKDINRIKLRDTTGGVELPSHCCFTSLMGKFCEKEYEISEVITPRVVNGELVGFYHLKNDPQGWTFTDEMLEDIESTNVVLGNLSMSFYDLMN